MGANRNKNKNKEKRQFFQKQNDNKLSWKNMKRYWFDSDIFFPRILHIDIQILILLCDIDIGAIILCLFILFEKLIFHKQKKTINKSIE